MEKTSEENINVQEMLQLQLSEVEMLSSIMSMFANPGEFVLEDPMCLAEIQEFVDGSSSYDKVHSRVGFTIKVKSSDERKVIFIRQTWSCLQSVCDHRSPS